MGLKTKGQATIIIPVNEEHRVGLFIDSKKTIYKLFLYKSKNPPEPHQCIRINCEFYTLEIKSKSESFVVENVVFKNTEMDSYDFTSYLADVCGIRNESIVDFRVQSIRVDKDAEDTRNLFFNKVKGKVIVVVGELVLDF
jgi:hypothetical protein